MNEERGRGEKQPTGGAADSRRAAAKKKAEEARRKIRAGVKAEAERRNASVIIVVFAGFDKPRRC